MPVQRLTAWRIPLFIMMTAFVCGTATAEEVPLRVERNHVFLEIEINGHPTVALLDTGAAMSWIDQELAAELGIGALWLVAEEGSGPQVRNDRTVPAAIRIGRDVADERTLGLIDIDPIFDDMPEDTPMPRAIIGIDVLRRYVVELDFDRELAVFTPADVYSDFPEQRPVSLERGVGGLAIVRMKLDGVEARSVVDTGATSAVHMSLDFAGAAGVASRAPSQILVGTVSGVDPRPVGALAVELSGTTFRNAPVTLSLAPIGRGIDAVVGMQLLGRFNLVLDLSRRRMWMTPNETFGAPFRRDRVGLHTLGGRGEEGAPLVLVAPGSPAEKAGFRIGEIVRELRDDAGAKIESGRDVAPGQNVTVVMGDGSLRTLVAAEYY